MKKLILISTVLLLAGCAATPEKLRQSEPDLLLESTNDSKQVADCIAEKWESLDYLIYSPVVNYRVKDSGYQITHYIDGELTYLADIKTTSAGSKVQVYTTSIELEFLEDKALSSVKVCSL
ncbi:MULTISPECIES: hypothetical protein [Aliivibrio]|uniref:hypothetical protein n=1 Tax=Aliivibrio TaxID=511678 RepID=UPI00031D5A34|nr:MULTISPECIES: hypothetical protein [Aliivibrio]MBD1571296.1 hypothetical protein [Aliivibrio sp. S10_S31]MUH97550.1 hypothetical protein [Aliivibrio fischeri]MUI62265.1 hypothetical protein [Aliivibrio fischeri]MUK27992.1 hypothetical protein [Aliivibrio fischeri]MUK34958.1 hypothetical protein [Aliivibrio fischeri]